MFTKQLLTLAGALSLVNAKTNPQETYTPAEIAAARASVLPYSPVSNVRGLAFDRFVDIWIENTVSKNSYVIRRHGLKAMIGL